MKRVLLSLLFTIANTLLIPTQAIAATFDEIKVIRPLTNNVLNPRLPFDIEIEFIGKDASNASNCDEFSNAVRFRAVIMDGNKHGLTLATGLRNSQVNDVNQLFFSFSKSTFYLNYTIV